MTEPVIDTYRKHKFMFADHARHISCPQSVLIEDPYMDAEPTDQGWRYTCPDCGITVLVQV